MVFRIICYRKSSNCLFEVLMCRLFGTPKNKNATYTYLKIITAAFMVHSQKKYYFLNTMNIKKNHISKFSLLMQVFLHSDLIYSFYFQWFSKQQNERFFFWFFFFQKIYLYAHLRNDKPVMENFTLKKARIVTSSKFEF